MSKSRSTATKVGHINCPLCANQASINKSSTKTGKLFISCRECGALNNLHKNYQHYINKNGVFDDELPEPIPEQKPEILSELMPGRMSEESPAEENQKPSIPIIQKPSIFGGLFSDEGE